MYKYKYSVYGVLIQYNNILMFGCVANYAEARKLNAVYIRSRHLFTHSHCYKLQR